MLAIKAFLITFVIWAAVASIVTFFIYYPHLIFIPFVLFLFWYIYLAVYEYLEDL